MKTLMFVLSAMMTASAWCSWGTTDTQIWYTEPITVRVMYVYQTTCTDNLSDYSRINFNIANNWLITDADTSCIYFKYTAVSNDFTVGLSPASTGIPSFFSLPADIPESISIPDI